MFSELNSDINSFKSSLLHLTGQPYWKKNRSAKVKDGIITYFLGTISLDDTKQLQEMSENQNLKERLLFILEMFTSDLKTDLYIQLVWLLSTENFNNLFILCEYL